MFRTIRFYNVKNNKNYRSNYFLIETIKEFRYTLGERITDIKLGGSISS